MNKEEIIKQLYGLPKIEQCKAVSEYTSVSIEDIENAIDKMNENKIYYELVRENKQLQDKITNAKIYMRDNMSLREYDEHYMNLMLILKGDSNE